MYCGYFSQPVPPPPPPPGLSLISILFTMSSVEEKLFILCGEAGWSLNWVLFLPRGGRIQPAPHHNTVARRPPQGVLFPELRAWAATLSRSTSGLHSDAAITALSPADAILSKSADLMVSWYRSSFVVQNFLGLLGSVGQTRVPIKHCGALAEWHRCSGECMELSRPYFL